MHQWMQMEAACISQVHARACMTTQRQALHSCLKHPVTKLLFVIQCRWECTPLGPLWGLAHVQQQVRIKMSDAGVYSKVVTVLKP